MTDRRKFLKTLTASAGALSLPITVVAQESSKFLPSVVTYLLDEPKLVSTKSASASVLVTSPFRITGARSGRRTFRIRPVSVGNS